MIDRYCDNKIYEDFDQCKLHVSCYIKGDSRYHTLRYEPRSGIHVICYTLNGEGIIHYNGEKITVSSGDFFLCKNEKLLEYYTKENLWEFWWIEVYLPDSVFIDFFKGHCDIDNELINNYENALIFHQQCKYKIASIYATLIFYKFYDIIKNGTNPKQSDLFLKSIEYMNSHIDSFSLEELSKILYVSERTLINIFHKQTGKSPREYFYDIKLNIAKQLLCNKNMSIKDISYTLGFSSQFHFSFFFKNKTGICPHAFRKGVGLFRE